MSLENLTTSSFSGSKGSKLIPLYLIVGKPPSLGFFSSVDSEIVSGDLEDTIVFKVVESPVIGSVQFPDVQAVSKNVLLNLISTQSGDHLDLRRLRQEIRLIERYYEDQGFYQVKVRSVESPRKDGDPLVFHIREGVVKEIRVTGNYKTQEYVLTREMTTKVGDVLKMDQIREDIRRIYNLNYFMGLEPNIVPSENGYLLNLQVMERLNA